RRSSRRCAPGDGAGRCAPRQGAATRLAVGHPRQPSSGSLRSPRNRNNRHTNIIQRHHRSTPEPERETGTRCARRSPARPVALNPSRCHAPMIYHRPDNAKTRHDTTRAEITTPTTKHEKTAQNSHAKTPNPPTPQQHSKHPLRHNTIQNPHRAPADPTPPRPITPPNTPTTSTGTGTGTTPHTPQHAANPTTAPTPGAVQGPSKPDLGATDDASPHRQLRRHD
ncbi:hypothetical protein J3A74_000142, partial [Rhodococcus sp. PvP104]|nr:hypothetical protein [Rhodococcus sp. PvP104]